MTLSGSRLFRPERHETVRRRGSRLEHPGVPVCVLAYLSDLRHNSLGQSSADVRQWGWWVGKIFLPASLEEEAVRVYVQSTKGGLKSINQGLIVRS